ncbi:hypothetical protein DICPUDRAFT_156498 [Dictyostelium purpureum]|uniref:Uncharacterized protein n=1 Tax=Dictyostelium purpureum TaxID=5786 RepID=F0ZWQ7_DICPU|nr:uncharacterized protein DICPUDRAFT_156498 [Dictyostelium purpureum]EGC31619.1 hypothetical protein DICPUDRAFT_156498 [Dictyostelium purpureum]|eukprot:XP_003291847.1 hypothetical protein DICPUDRAFT_156498 [Dictyostelium purpureum]
MNNFINNNSEVNNAFNNEINEEYMDVDIDSIDLMDEKQIKKISKSFKLVFKKEKKSAIVQKIKDAIISRKMKYNNNSSNDNNSSLNNNDNNNNTININNLNNNNNNNNDKQETTPNGEKLFWKVFKNKYLFKKIMSNMNESAIPWHAIYSHRFMFRQKMYEVFKFKVKRGEYIAFDNYMNSIYQEIQDDEEFYRAFFNNYPEYFEHYGKAFHQAIDGDCLVAIKAIVQDSLFIPTLNTLLKAISRHRFKVVKYLLQPQFQLAHQITEEMVCDEVFSSRDINTFEIINYFIELKIITGDKKIRQFIQKTHKDFFISLAPHLYSFSVKLRVVLNLCKFIHVFNIPLNTQNQPQYHQEPNILISYDEILKLYFTDEQLESGLDSPINYNNKESRESIIKLVNLVHCVDGLGKIFGRKFALLYLYQADIDLLIKSNHLNSFIDNQRLLTKSFQFGCFNLFVMGCEYHRNFFCYETFELFKFCPNKEKQVEFLTSLIKGYKENPLFKKVVSPERLLHPLFGYGDLDSVKLVFKDLIEIIEGNQGEFDIGELGIIKSTEILDYIFYNYNKYFIFNENRKTTLYLFGFKMIKYYNQLVRSYSNQLRANGVETIPEFIKGVNNLDHDNYGLKDEFNLQDSQITSEITKNTHKIKEITEQYLIRGNDKAIIKLIEAVFVHKHKDYKESIEHIINKVVQKHSLSALNEILASYPDIFNTSLGVATFTKQQVFRFLETSIKANFLKGSEILFQKIKLSKKQFLYLEFNNPTFNYLNFKYLKY